MYGKPNHEVRFSPLRNPLQWVILLAYNTNSPMNISAPTHKFGLSSSIIDAEEYPVYFIDTHVFTIDSEGTLYQSLRFLDGSFNDDIWEETNYEELGGDEYDDVSYAHDTLIEQAKQDGWYHCK